MGKVFAWTTSTGQRSDATFSSSRQGSTANHGSDSESIPSLPTAADYTFKTKFNAGYTPASCVKSDVGDVCGRMCRGAASSPAGEALPPPGCDAGSGKTILNHSGRNALFETSSTIRSSLSRQNQVGSSVANAGTARRNFQSNTGMNPSQLAGKQGWKNQHVFRGNPAGNTGAATSVLAGRHGVNTATVAQPITLSVGKENQQPGRHVWGRMPDKFNRSRAWDGASHQEVTSQRQEVTSQQQRGASEAVGKSFVCILFCVYCLRQGSFAVLKVLNCEIRFQDLEEVFNFAKM